ncbi:MAG: hypothetical protein EOO15_01225 [Chitinophagaceae bacterium]|nr:MAG: hypothetical protein EOO15_01225 [Chitinophagaceae bacterium]
MLNQLLPRPSALACLILLSHASSASLAAPAVPPSADLTELRHQLEELRQQYEARLRAMEERLSIAEQRTSAPAPQAATMPLETPTASANAFNPQVSLILSGGYSHLKQDPDHWKISGFVPGGEIGPGPRGFNLGESELGLYANVDPWFYGGLNLAVSPDNEVSAEEAFIQTTALPYGLRLKAGRFFSGIGYLNEQHAHTWDFVDSPLAYQAFLGSQLAQDGAQLKWLLPTDRFIELGAEVGRGAAFPGSERRAKGAGTTAFYAHTGGDWNDSSNWRAGVSYLLSRPQDRTWQDNEASPAPVTNAFSGDSRLWILDGVWKWAPYGNATRTNFKLQGEYFHRVEKGLLTFDVDGSANTDAYRSAQSGWYLQGIYQFMPAWRVGLRHDQLDSGSVDYASNSVFLTQPDFKPRRTSLMLDWSLSEFSRWRVQLAQDRARQDSRDTQVFLQYQMSLGAHGAHGY